MTTRTVLVALALHAIPALSTAAGVRETIPYIAPYNVQGLTLSSNAASNVLNFTVVNPVVNTSAICSLSWTDASGPLPSFVPCSSTGATQDTSFKAQVNTTYTSQANGTSSFDITIADDFEIAVMGAVAFPSPTPWNLFVSAKSSVIFDKTALKSGGQGQGLVGAAMMSQPSKNSAIARPINESIATLHDSVPFLTPYTVSTLGLRTQNNGSAGSAQNVLTFSVTNPLANASANCAISWTDTTQPASNWTRCSSDRTNDRSFNAKLVTDFKSTKADSTSSSFHLSISDAFLLELDLQSANDANWGYLITAQSYADFKSSALVVAGQDLRSLSSPLVFQPLQTNATGWPKSDWNAEGVFF